MYSMYTFNAYLYPINYLKTKNMTHTTETKLEDLANQMAVKFEENITASKLCRWVGLANEAMNEYIANGNKGDDGASFLNSISWQLLPELIECTNKEERITYLRNAIPEFFWLNGAKWAISIVGESYMDHLSKYTIYKEGADDFFDIFKSFIHILDIYEDYDFQNRLTLKVA